MIILLILCLFFNVTISTPFSDKYRVNIDLNKINIWKIEFPINNLYMTIDAEHKLSLLEIDKFIEIKILSSYAYINKEENLLIIIDDQYNIKCWNIHIQFDGRCLLIPSFSVALNKKISHVGIVGQNLIVVEDNSVIYFWSFYKLLREHHDPNRTIKLDNKLNNLSLSKNNKQLIISTSIDL